MLTTSGVATITTATLVDPTLTLTTPRNATVTSTPSNRCYCNDDNFGKGCYFNGDHKEVSYFTDGYTEDGFFNGQGAIKTLYYVRWRSRPSYTHARTGAKVSSNCTPKVQATTKPEETTKQDRKGTTNY